MALIVQKYGGSSVGDVARIQRVAKNIAQFQEAGHQIIVTVSAPAGTTDQLTALAKDINARPPSREMDMLLSTGEQISIALLAMALDAVGVPVISLTGPQLGIITDDAHTKARIMEIKPERIKEELEQGKVIIVAGFQGMTLEREITTLGRGGSDTTAVAIAAAMEADLCEIYTDVDGVYTADPRVVTGSSKLAQITYDEMLELASLGAKVLHPRSVELAKIHKVKLCVRSSFDTSKEGTFVVDHEKLEKEYVVTGVASDLNVAKIGLFDIPDHPGIANQIFTALAGVKVNVDMIVQSAMRNNVNNIAFTVPQDELEKALEVMNHIKDEVGISEVAYAADVAKISIVGAGMVSSTGVAAKMFSTLAEKNINLEMISTSEIKVSCIIKHKGDDVKIALQSLHDAFELDKLH